MVNPEVNRMKRLISGRLSVPAAGPHPEAEQLAALVERAISKEDRRSLLEHVAACRDCREILYLSLPDAAENQQILAYPRRRPRLAIGWATLAASVVIVGSLVITNRDAFEHRPAIEPVASAPAGNALEKQYSSRNAKAQIKSLQTEKASPAPVAEARLKTRPAEKHMTAKPQGSMQFDQSGEVHFTGNSANEVEHFASAPEARPAPQPAPVAQTAAVKAANPQALRVEAQARQVDALAKVSEADLATPLWRVGADGVPQRSLDGGQNWQAASAPTGTFHAVSSVGRDIWLGGSDGLLYHSSDSGQNWARISPAMGSTKLESDITHITFTDTLTGTISTVNGQVWSTSDGGQSWRVK